MKQSRLLAVILALALLIPLFPATLAAPPAAESAPVKIGAEVLLESAEWKEYLSGKNVALYTNQVCVDYEMNHLAELLAADPDINMVATFAGEHGINGDYQAGAHVPHAVDPRGFIAWSMYSGGTINTLLGKAEAAGMAPVNTSYFTGDLGLPANTVDPNNPGRPTAVMLTGNNGAWYQPVDVILFDLQEIGGKNWTYIYTLADLMLACVEAARYYDHEVELIVLDRPSTISSDVVEGTMTTSNNASGISRYDLPARYGLTMGEVAMLYQGEGFKHYWSADLPGGNANRYGSGTAAPANWDWDAANMANKISLGECPVTVIPCEGYTRDMYWDETGLQFINPSPNIPTWEAALLFSGTVWFEGPNVNEGRGTVKAFEQLTGAFIDPIELAAALNALELAGVEFRASSQYIAIAGQGGSGANSYAHGVQIHVTDKRAISTIEVTVACYLTLKALYGAAFTIPSSVDARTGSTWVRTEFNAFAQGSTTAQIKAKTAAMLVRMEAESEDYRLNIRPKYLMSKYDTPADKTLANTPQATIDLGYEAILDNLTNVGGVNLKTASVGLVAGPASVDKQYNHIADVLKQAGVNLTTLFGPETGMRGELWPAGTGAYTDCGVGTNGTRLPAYRINTVPTTAQMEGLDALIFDMQDSGTRSNSYVKLMADCMLAAQEAGIPFIVLDRPNPLGGELVDGPVDAVGGYPIPANYGMTLGELALLIQGEFGHATGAALDALDLTVIPLSNWSREMTFEDTGLQYVMPNPRIASTTANALYAATNWLDGTGAWVSSAANQKGLSSGWGTTKSYEYFGAPFLSTNLVAYVNALSAANLPGINFRIASMTPWSQSNAAAGIKYPGAGTSGAQIHLYDSHVFSPVDTALTILTVTQRMFPEQVAEMFTGEFDAIVGNTWLKGMIQAGNSVAEIKAAYQDDLAAFAALREDYLLYTSDADAVEVNLRATQAQYLTEEDPTFIVSVENVMDQINYIDLTFEVTGETLHGKVANALSGFITRGGVSWDDLGGDRWQGRILLEYHAGALAEAADVLELVFDSTGVTGTARAKITGVVIQGLREDGQYVEIASNLGRVVASVPIVTRPVEYSKYDLNRDGFIDSLDYGIMLFYVNRSSADSDWTTYWRVSDVNGAPIYAYRCDVGGDGGVADGVVDIADLLDLILHYNR